MGAMRFIFTAVVAALVLSVQTAVAKVETTRTAIGIHGAIGTDPTLGLGYGVGLGCAFLPPESNTAFELKMDGFLAHVVDVWIDEDVPSGNLEGTDTTDLTLVGVRADGLFNYNPRKGSVFFIAGFGFCWTSVEWERKYRALDSRIYTYVPPTIDREGTGVGNIVNFGLGFLAKSGFEVRLEFPMIYMYNKTGEAAQFVPTATITLGYRFL